MSWLMIKSVEEELCYAVKRSHKQINIRAIYVFVVVVVVVVSLLYVTVMIRDNFLKISHFTLGIQTKMM